MKIYQALSCPDGFKKLLLMIKIWMLIIALSAVQASANVYSQASKINIEMSQVSIEQVMDQIKNKSSYKFVYRADLFSGLPLVNASFVEATPEQILDELLTPHGFRYDITDNIVVVRKVETEQLQQPPQQERLIITGVVTDGDGMSLPGVSVWVKGRTAGTSTDAEGKYTLRAYTHDQVLVFSFVGMKTREIEINGRSVINVEMEEDVLQLDQVVVTGYYTADRRTYTGAATTISGADLMRVSSGNVLQTIQSLDPSFHVIEDNFQGSNPNILPEIELRGEGSLPGLRSEFQYNPNMPTFIVDGFEVAARNVFDMDPNRIESITILKDAAAAAIYGSRAANGVVVIETKVPPRGRLRVDYKADVRFSAADLSDYNLLNAREKMQYELLAGIYPGEYPITIPNLERNWDEYYNKMSLVEMGYDTYWLAQPIHSLSAAHTHSLQIQEGTENFRYNLNLFLDNDNGVMKESYRNRLGIGAYFQYRLNNLLFMNNLTYDRILANHSPYGSFSQYALANPYLPFEDVHGNAVKYFEFVNTPNPMYNADIGVIDQAGYNRIVNNFKLEWTVVPGLRFRSSFAFSHTEHKSEEFLPADHTNFRHLYGSSSHEEHAKAGTYRNQYEDELRLDGNIIVNYFKELGDHTIIVNAGTNVVTQEGDILTYRIRGFPSPLLSHPSFGTTYDMESTSGGATTPGGSEDISHMIGFLGTVNYTWKNKYFTDLSARTDASSKFGANNRWSKLWSVGLGWNVHEENFLQGSHLINMLRLRASTGFTGSQNYNPNQSLTMLNYIRGNYYNWTLPGARLVAMGNENLKWQRTRKNNIGVDIQLLDRRLSGSFNLYFDVSMDALTQVSLPPSAGFMTYTENLGQVRNNGFEGNLSFNVFTSASREIMWTIFGSMAHNKNTLLKISNALEAWNAEQDATTSSNPKVRFVEGQDMKSIWVVPSAGIDPATGQEVFISRTGAYALTWDPADQVVGGTMTPFLFGNFGSQFSYRQWRMNIFLMYSVGGQMYNQTLVSRVENANPHFNVDRRALEDRWQQEGDISRFKSIADMSATQPTSRFVEDNNFLRLTSFNISYQFKPEQLERYALKELRLILYANDVFNISSIKQERGLSYPFARSFSITAQISF